MIVVAVVVPVAVLAAVGAVLLMRCLHLRSVRARTSAMKSDLKEKELSERA